MRQVFVVLAVNPNLFFFVYLWKKQEKLKGAFSYRESAFR